MSPRQLDIRREKGDQNVLSETNMYKVQNNNDVALKKKKNYFTNSAFHIKFRTVNKKL